MTVRLSDIPTKLLFTDTLRLLTVWDRQKDPVAGVLHLPIRMSRAGTRFKNQPVRFSDRINWFVMADKPELWNIFNFTTDTHPVHLHLVQFQMLRRASYKAPKAGDDGLLPSGAFVQFQQQGSVDANEAGWKDTVRVNPGDGITIAALFEGFTGRYMYHCHVLEHEEEMMRPFIVMPKEVHPFMHNRSGGDHGGMMH